MAPPKDDENTMDGKKNEPGSIANGRYLQDADNFDKTKTVEVPGTCSEKRHHGEGLPFRHDRRKKSKGKTEEQVYGRCQGAGWMRRNRRGATSGAG